MVVTEKSKKSLPETQGFSGGGFDGKSTYHPLCNSFWWSESLMTNLINPSDRIAIFGARGMAGSAISRALARAGYQQQLAPTRAELDLLDLRAVQQWFAEFQPTVVVLAAAKVGGIQANNSYPADFLLDNLKMQTHGIETAGTGYAGFFLTAAALRLPETHPEQSLLTGRLSHQ